jgi:hypothetical protein
LTFREGDLYSQRILLIEMRRSPGMTAPGHCPADQDPTGGARPKLYLVLGLSKPGRVVELFTRRLKLRNG